MRLDHVAGSLFALIADGDDDQDSAYASIAEPPIGGRKPVIGGGLRSGIDKRRATEVDVAAHVLNPQAGTGPPGLCPHWGCYLSRSDPCTTPARKRNTYASAGCLVWKSVTD